MEGTLLLRDLRRRVPQRIQLTTNGWGSYAESVEDEYGADIDYAQVVKHYVSPEREGRRGAFLEAEHRVLQGNPDPDLISTSYIERQNLTMRMSMKRFQRFTNGFSKKVENLAAAALLHFMFYNFGRVHGSLKKPNGYPTTPAMAAGVTDHVWTLKRSPGWWIRLPAMVPRIGYLETGVIYCGDNLERLSRLPSESMDLIYLDPPFFSNRHYEVIWGDEAEIRSFEDRWEGGIEVYVAWMRERVIEMHRVLKSTGSFYLHCDWHAGHYLKVMCDEVFGARNFLNEIVWHYETAGGAPKKWLHRNHDTIFRYAKKKALVTWNAPLKPWPETTLKKWQKDEQGRIYHAQNKRGKRYYINPDGKLDDDVWDITLGSRDSERLGYPTQKPEELLEKIVEASSNPSDIVFDPFAGCGTALVVAHRLKRQWIGIDISPTACELMRRRMLKVGAEDLKLSGMPLTEAELRTLMPFEFQNWVVQKFNSMHSPRKTSDMGIDGLSFMEHNPIQVKRSDRIGRNVVDNFETAVERTGKAKGYIVGFSFTKGAYEEAARVKRAKGLEIQLVTVADLLSGEVPDLAGGAFGQLIPDDLPLPKPRDAAARPSVADLVSSDVAASQAAEDAPGYETDA